MNEIQSKLEKVRGVRIRLRSEIEERERQAREQKRATKQLRSHLKTQQRQEKHLKAELELQKGGLRGFLARFRFQFYSNVELRKENAKLRAEVQRLRRIESAAKSAGDIAARVIAGAELQDAWRSWMPVAREARKPRDLFNQESADLVAAMSSRVIRVGTIGLVVAALPMVMLAWQNFLIRRQVELQASDNLIVHRTQLLATIYELWCEPAVPVPVDGGDTDGSVADADTPSSQETTLEDEDADSKTVCFPRAPLRARQEAAIAFAKIERERNTGIDLSKADLRKAKLNGANFRQANLSEAWLSEADLSEADLREADLRKAQFLGADLSGAKLLKVNLSDSFLNGADFSGADLTEAILNGSDLTAFPDDNPVILVDAVLRDSLLVEVDLQEAVLIGADIRGAALRGADLRHALISNADLRETDLARADLSYAELIEADLSEANFSGAILFGADLSGADLSGALNLSWEQIDIAVGNTETKLPANLSMPNQWHGKR